MPDPTEEVDPEKKTESAPREIAETGNGNRPVEQAFHPGDAAALSAVRPKSGATDATPSLPPAEDVLDFAIAGEPARQNDSARKPSSASDGSAYAVHSPESIRSSPTMSQLFGAAVRSEGYRPAHVNAPVLTEQTMANLFEQARQDGRVMRLQEAPHFISAERTQVLTAEQAELSRQHFPRARVGDPPRQVEAGDTVIVRQDGSVNDVLTGQVGGEFFSPESVAEKFMPAEGKTGGLFEINPVREAVYLPNGGWKPDRHRGTNIELQSGSIVFANEAESFVSHLTPSEVLGRVEHTGEFVPQDESSKRAYEAARQDILYSEQQVDRQFNRNAAAMLGTTGTTIELAKAVDMQLSQALKKSLNLPPDASTQEIETGLRAAIKSRGLVSPKVQAQLGISGELSGSGLYRKLTEHVTDTIMNLPVGTPPDVAQRQLEMAIDRAASGSTGTKSAFTPDGRRVESSVSTKQDTPPTATDASGRKPLPEDILSDVDFRDGRGTPTRTQGADSLTGTQEPRDATGGFAEAHRALTEKYVDRLFKWTPPGEIMHVRQILNTVDGRDLHVLTAEQAELARQKLPDGIDGKPIKPGDIILLLRGDIESLLEGDGSGSHGRIYSKEAAAETFRPIEGKPGFFNELSHVQEATLLPHGPWSQTIQGSASEPGSVIIRTKGEPDLGFDIVAPKDVGTLVPVDAGSENALRKGGRPIIVDSTGVNLPDGTSPEHAREVLAGAINDAASASGKAETLRVKGAPERALHKLEAAPHGKLGLRDKMSLATAGAIAAVTVYRLFNPGKPDEKKQVPEAQIRAK